MSTIRIGKELLVVRTCKSERLKRIHECNVCKRKFYSARKTAKYCSEACRQAAYRDRKLMNSY